MRSLSLALLAGVAFFWPTVGAHAQVIGSYDNFDCFNDTGETAEGFEIDVEDVSQADLTRQFPSNFSTTPWVIRYGLPKVTSYDFSVASPDAAHAYDAGHKGVLITWAASWNGTQWLAQYGAQPFGPTQLAGNGTPYVANPSYTNGDSCWYYGLGQAYPSSGCDHFGISFASGVAPGLISYHWQIADPANPGHLKNAALEASIPPSPALYYNPPLPGAPPVVNVVAEAPEHEADPALNPDLQFGTAYWVKVTTLFAPKRAQLDKLQKRAVKQYNGPKRIAWALLQRPPKLDPAAAEREDNENEVIPAGDVQVTKQYEYFKFQGAYDAEDHGALCNPAVACRVPTTATYTVSTHGHGGGTVTVTVTGGDQGAYIGAHVNAYNVN